MDPLLVSVEQAAQALGIGRSLAYEQIASGALPHVKVGRRTLVPTQALHEWVSERLLATRAGYNAAESAESGALSTLSGGFSHRRTTSEGAPHDRRPTTGAPLREVV